MVATSTPRPPPIETPPAADPRPWPDALVENIQDVLTVLDEEGRIRWNSPSVRAVLGYEPASLTGLAALDLVHPEDVPAAAALLAQAVATPDHVASITYRFRHRDGSWRYMEAVGKSLLHDPLVRGLVVTCRDVTERVLAARAATEEREAAERASRAKSDFLARTSHELRTPLNAILGFAGLLEMELAAPAERESARQIALAGRHLLRLMEEVLEIAASETASSALALQPLSACEAVGEVLDLLRPLAARQGICLFPPVSDSTSLRVLSDPQRLRQVLLNLVSNAIKYNVPGGSVRLAATARGEWLRISVHDTGPGISAEGLTRLFTPFERLGAAGTGIEGTGLGLALSRTLAERMGGRMGVESTLGVGSDFWVELPVVAASAVEERTGATV